MKRKIITTADGSSTIHLEDWNEQYHSKHGAIQEAYHVFIKHGLEFLSHKEISILEIGFGTGLNAFITYLEANKNEKVISYQGVEAFPVGEDEVVKLNYVSELNAKDQAGVFKEMHQCTWNQFCNISSNFKLKKREEKFEAIDDVAAFDLIYFDAFGARVQPELWTVEIFKQMYAALKNKGVIVTYSAKGSVRRAMQEVGFTVERLPGPPGKREMLRGVK